MTTPNEQLTEAVFKALVDAKIVSEKQSTTLSARILSGAVEAEDWSLAIENTIAENQAGVTDGK
jgi:hypothetical protein